VSTTVNAPADTAVEHPYPYLWAWGQKPGWTVGRDGKLSPPRVFDRDRKDERCRVVARGSMNSALIEFETDRYRTVTSRNGLRRADRGGRAKTAPPPQPPSPTARPQAKPAPPNKNPNRPRRTRRFATQHGH